MQLQLFLIDLVLIVVMLLLISINWQLGRIRRRLEEPGQDVASGSRQGGL